MPSDVARTIDGDLDFERFDPSRHWQLGEFEFDRSVLALRRAEQSQRVRQLMNLVHYPGFREAPGGRQWLEALIAGSGITSDEGAAVLDAFEGEVRRAR